MTTLSLTGCKSASLYEEINALVLEYLELNGLEKTITAFSSECRARSLPGPFNSKDDTKAAFSHYEGEKLLKAFDDGDLDGFVKLFKSFQGHVQVTSDDMKKLEVYIRVHFALWPCAHGEPEAVQTQAMNHLKIFFEEQSSHLSHDAAILPLFALPYVADPKNHPIFRDLFQPTWSQRLRSQLEATLVKYYDLLQQNLGVHSKLAALVVSSKPKESHLVLKDEDGDNEVNRGSASYHQQRFFQLVKTYRQVRRLLRTTRESYGKLLKISNELIVGLEATVGGQKLSLEPIMRQCYEIFPELFTPVDTQGTPGQPDKEYFKKLAQNAHFDNIIDSDVSLFFIGITDVTPEKLDFVKIKAVLRNDGTCNLDRLCLLQSLRWLLTKSTPKCRRTTIDAFIEADLLGLRPGEESYRNKIFESLLSPTPTYLKECFARLLNTFGSMKCGRAYLSMSIYTVEMLVKSLHTFRGLNESYICQMVIATLQKLSLRKHMRLEMISRKVIQWLVTYLKSELARTEGAFNLDSKYYNPYLMEYAWALLMNLCLHDESRPACSSIANDIISCVTQMLLSKPSREVYPYVISTLYSLLRNPDIFAAAKKMGIQSMFASCQKIEDTEMAHHFNHVTAILQADGFDRVNTTTGEVDYDDDDDIDPSDFEPELEVSEAWEDSLTEANPTGDDLLMRSYLKTADSNIKNVPSLPSPASPKPPKGNPSKMPTVFTRPTTPSSCVTPTGIAHDYLMRGTRTSLDTVPERPQSLLPKPISRSPSTSPSRNNSRSRNGHRSPPVVTVHQNSSRRRNSDRSPSLSPRRDGTHQYRGPIRSPGNKARERPSDLLPPAPVPTPASAPTAKKNTQNSLSTSSSRSERGIAPHTSTTEERRRQPSRSVLGSSNKKESISSSNESYGNGNGRNTHLRQKLPQRETSPAASKKKVSRLLDKKDGHRSLSPDDSAEYGDHEPTLTLFTGTKKHPG